MTCSIVKPKLDGDALVWYHGVDLGERLKDVPPWAITFNPGIVAEAAAAGEPRDLKLKLSIGVAELETLLHVQYQARGDIDTDAQVARRAVTRRRGVPLFVAAGSQQAATSIGTQDSKKDEKIVCGVAGCNQVFAGKISTGLPHHGDARLGGRRRTIRGRVLKLRGNKLAKWPNQLDSLKNLETLDLSKNDLAHMAPVRVAQSEEQKTAAVKPGEVAIGAPDPKQCDWAGLASTSRTTPSPSSRSSAASASSAARPSRNKRFVPKEIRSLGELKFFHLHENRLKTADMSRAEFATLKALEVLTSDNYLEELPPEFADLPRLRKLTMSHNPCAAEVHAALAPFVDGLRVRATHAAVSRAAFRPQPAGVEDSSAARAARRAATLTGASQGAELERGDVAEAVAPLVAAADAQRASSSRAPRATVSHHVHLGAARVSIAKQRRALAEADKFERLERDRKARREEELRRARREKPPRRRRRTAAATTTRPIYYAGLAAYELDDARQAIYDLDDALALRLRALVARAPRQGALRVGPVPQGKRDCLKAKRLLLTERGLNMPEPDEQAPRAVAEVLDELELNDVSREVERGLDALHLLGVDDKNMHRVYDVSPQDPGPAEVGAQGPRGDGRSSSDPEMRKRKHDSACAT
ncbi:hypothetical protein JL722_15216 [Aureococcus anophagefferens]|nr:hypothetical protein JL722_15216 [Aureococcus anophagefferens]